MHRTLFTPAMIETFRSCQKAYELAFIKYTNGGSSAKASVLCKKFMLRCLAEINRGRLMTVNQVQKYTGQHWPVEKLSEQVGEKDIVTRAFLFAYKSLLRYVVTPYRPSQSEVVSVALRVRARIAHVRVYVEDTLDMVVWHPEEKRLEIVDFQLQPLKPFDPAWPSSAQLVRYFLAEKLKQRWAFEKLTFTQYRIGPQEFQPMSFTLEESIFRIHWEEMVKTLEDMKQVSHSGARSCSSVGKDCPHCDALLQTRESADDKVVSFRLSA